MCFFAWPAALKLSWNTNHQRDHLGQGHLSRNSFKQTNRVVDSLALSGFRKLTQLLTPQKTDLIA